MLTMKIVKMIPFHCAKGPRGCSKCKTLVEEGEKFCLIELFPEPIIAAWPLIELEIDGEKVNCEFKIVKIFKDDTEAKEYAIKNGIDILS